MGARMCVNMLFFTFGYTKDGALVEGIQPQNKGVTWHIIKAIL